MLLHFAADRVGSRNGTVGRRARPVGWARPRLAQNADDPRAIVGTVALEGPGRAAAAAGHDLAGLAILESRAAGSGELRASVDARQARQRSALRRAGVV